MSFFFALKNKWNTFFSIFSYYRVHLAKPAAVLITLFTSSCSVENGAEKIFFHYLEAYSEPCEKFKEPFANFIFVSSMLDA